MSKQKPETPVDKPDNEAALAAPDNAKPKLLWVNPWFELMKSQANPDNDKEELPPATDKPDGTPDK